MKNQGEERRRRSKKVLAVFVRRPVRLPYKPTHFTLEQLKATVDKMST